MENEQEAQQAIRSLNGHILNGNRINVEVSGYSNHNQNLCINDVLQMVSLKEWMVRAAWIWHMLTK